MPDFSIFKGPLDTSSWLNYSGPIETLEEALEYCDLRELNRFKPDYEGDRWRLYNDETEEEILFEVFG